jgi:hypothetical protein
MKYINILLAACLVITMASCKKMSYFQINPNEPTVADPSLELSNIEQNLFSVISVDAGLASRQLVYTQSASNSQYYGWQRSGMNYSSISQVVKMQQEAARVNKPNYIYLGKFFTDYYIIQMTQTFGDIPCSQMMQSMNNNFDTSATHPVYDKQHDVYLAVLNDLKIASDSLSTTGGSIVGDIIYNGNIMQWKKLINSFTLRVLMSLSKKESDASLNIVQRFNDMVSSPDKYPLLSSNSDNGELRYDDITGNRYPYYNNNSMKTDYYLDSTFVQMLQNLKDPRLFTYGQPTPNAVAAGLPATDFEAYGGLWGSGDLGYNISKRGAGKVSAINPRYAYDPVNEPGVLMSYAEVQFILAEAVVRGWITGNAETYYENGIQASMEFSDYNNTYSNADIQNYLSQPAIALQPATAIQRIITQKYISMFMNGGWQPFYEHRRTGYPEFEVAGTGIINKVKGANAVPLRWMYPLDEYTNNAVNVQNAVSRQYPDGDDINGVMWLIQ